MRKLFINASAVIWILSFPLIVSSQILNPKDKVKREGEGRINNRIDRTIDKGFDKIDEGVDNLFNGNKKNKQKNNNDDRDNSIDNNDYNSSAPGSTSINPQNTQPDRTDFSQYKGSSFVPGKDLLFFEDFSTAGLGSGPGNWHVVNWDQENPAHITRIHGSQDNWMKITRYGIFFPNSFKSLPENCTIEFDMYINSETVSEMQSGLRFSFVAREDRENFDLHFNESPEVMIDIHPFGKDGIINFFGSRQNGLSEELSRYLDKNYKGVWNTGRINRVAVVRKGMGLSVFVNGKEYVNVPNAFLVKADYNFMMSSNQWGDGIYITNIRVGANAQNAADEMKTDGKFVTNTIYFDVNSSRIKPESWPSLKQASDAIKATSGNILIVGHTDSDGSDDSNLKLSLKRADAVKYVLIHEFGIPEFRLITDGKGESQPIESNSTASGKAKNRRVEFIKQ